VLIVLAIISLVVTVVGPRLMAQLDRSKASAATLQIRSLMASLETMKLDIGRYPDEVEGLPLLVRRPEDESGALWRGPYLDSALPNDPWGRPYLYTPSEASDGRPSVGTLGADGREGGDGLDADIYFGGDQEREEPPA